MITNIEAVASGTYKDINWRVSLSPLKYFVNGYVELPSGHPWVGLHYDDIPAEAHGGLTYAQDNVIGFDTGHAFDIWTNETLAPAGGEINSAIYPGLSAAPDKWIIHWTVDMVIAETKRLAKQVANSNTQRKSVK